MDAAPLSLPVEDVLAADAGDADDAGGETIGTSREGRPIVAHRLGRGSLHVSLVAGNHADEPVGPETLRRLVAFLRGRDAADPLLAGATWWIVPHTNPDGAARNAGWSDATVALPDGGRGYDLGRYLREAVREPPGDDVEFGFPRDDADDGARPENRAVAAFLRPGAPFALHASLHGMGFAAGPWFLLEEAWADRTTAMRDALRRRVRELGYDVHDVDRGGEKGFRRIDRGFTTRPDSRAMAAHFIDRGDATTAALFRPSSMEMVRAWGGDPLTLVSEMPLFLLPPEVFAGPELVRPPELAKLRAAALRGDDALDETTAEIGVRGMPIEDQSRFQLAYLDAALSAVQRNPR